MSEARLSSGHAASILAGANTLLVETDAGWEMLGFVDATLIGQRQYRLTRLLRGLQGTDVAAGRGAAQGAAIVLLETVVERADIGAHEIGVGLVWQAGLFGETRVATFNNVQGLAWRPVHLRLVSSAQGRKLTWLSRGPDRPDNWDLPEPRLSEVFEIEWTSSVGQVQLEIVEGYEAGIPEIGQSVRIRQIGMDGRAGPWSSILTLE